MKYRNKPKTVEAICRLNALKQKAINHFREWIHQGMPDKYEDLYADFKPMLTQDTSTGYDGGKIEGDMPQ